MKVKTLHRILGDMIRLGCGHKSVCIDKETFVHALESDGAVILQVETAKLETHEMIDDDGGLKVNKDGTNTSRTALVLRGSETRCDACHAVDSTWTEASTPHGFVAG